MESDEKKNITKIIITIIIILVAFLIILVSALVTLNIKNKKDSSTIDSEQAIVENKNSKENIENDIDIDNEVENNIEDEVENEENSFGKILNQVQESINNYSNTTEVQETPVTQRSPRLPVPNPNAIALCKDAQNSSEKNIYLTFDDGPSPNITPQILEILKQYDVPATFFVLGSRVELYPEILKREYNEGHYIANHGYSHQYSSIYSSVQAVIDEYNSTEKAIQDALGIPEFHSYLFRFPGGSSGGVYDEIKGEAKRTLQNIGIASTNWNCLSGDAEALGRTKEQLLKRLYETAERWDSLVVLMHDANDKQPTVDALPEIIEHYKNEGYTFKNYYDIFQ